MKIDSVLATLRHVGWKKFEIWKDKTLNVMKDSAWTSCEQSYDRMKSIGQGLVKGESSAQARGPRVDMSRFEPKQSLQKLTRTLTYPVLHLWDSHNLRFFKTSFPSYPSE